MAGFGEALRDLRQARGLSLRGLGRLVHYSHGYLHDLEQGRKPPSPEIAARLDQALGAGGELIRAAAAPPHLAVPAGMVSRRWIDEVAVRVADGVIPAATFDPPRRLGSEDIARIEATTQAFRDWDNRWGGGLAQAAVLGQLHWVRACARYSSLPSIAARNRLLSALSDLAAVAAFRYYDVKRHADARALWLLGLNAADEAGNADLVGATLRQMAHQALHLGDPEEATRLVQLARTSAADCMPGARDRALAETAAYEGWCHAALGRVGPTHQALGRAEEHFARVDSASAPPWLAHLDACELTALRGHAYHVLAHHEPVMATLAADLLRAAIAGRADAYARSRTLNLIALAAAHFQRGDSLDEGIAVGDAALDGAETLGSPRALDRLRDLLHLTGGHRNEPGVRDFRQRIDAVISSA